MKVLPVFNNIEWSKEGVNFPLFLNESLKVEYIEEKLMNGNELQTLFNGVNDVGSFYLSANTGKVIINIDRLPNEYTGKDINYLKNVNALILDNGNDINKYDIWFVDSVAVENAKNIEYKVTFDPLSSLFHRILYGVNGNIFVRRAFVNRLNDNLDYWDFSKNSYIHKVEQISSNVGGSQVKTTETIVYRDAGIPTLSDLEREVSNTNWLVVFTTRPASELDGTKYGINNILTTFTPTLELPYRVYIAPLPQEKGRFYLAYNKDGSQTIREWDAVDMYNELIGTDSVIGATIMQLNPMIDNGSYSITEQEINSKDRILFNIFSSTERYYKGIEVASTVYLRLLENQLNFRVYQKFDMTEVSPILSDIGIGIIKNYRNEPKLYTQPFSFYNIKHVSSDGFPISPNLLQNNTFTIQSIQSLTPELNKIHDYVFTGFYSNALQENACEITVNNYSLPTIINEWKQYVQNFKTQSTTGLATSSIGGLTQSAFGFATGNVVAGVGGIVQGATSVLGDYVKRQDIKSRPDKYRGAGNLTTFDYQLSLTTQLQHREIIESDLKQISSFFHKYAYSIADFISYEFACSSRYYFNYVECDNIEEILLNNADLSVETIKYINDKFKNGVRFWHYRDKTTYKGIGNYEYDNVEVDYI